MITQQEIDKLGLIKTEYCQCYIINGFPVFSWYGLNGAAYEFYKYKSLNLNN